MKGGWIDRYLPKTAKSRVSSGAECPSNDQQIVNHYQIQHFFASIDMMMFYELKWWARILRSWRWSRSWSCWSVGRLNTTEDLLKIESPRKRKGWELFQYWCLFVHMNKVMVVSWLAMTLMPKFKGLFA